MKYTQEQINENRQKWLKVLRDPVSKKTTSRLEDSKNPIARCCLGHACHALGAERIVSHNGEIFYGSSGDRKDEVLPKEVSQALNIQSNGDFYESITIQMPNKYIKAHGLAELNDKTDLNPQEIADVIEEQFKNDNLVSYNYVQQHWPHG